MARSIEFARLFVTLEAETKGLEQQLSQSEKSLGRFTSFITKNPLAALGALGGAAVAVGIQVTQMAGEVDAAFRKVAQSVPGATARLDELKEAGKELSTEFGISQTEVARQMEAVARTGVESTEDLIAASRAAVEAQRASGEEFSSIVGIIDTSMDVFGVAAGDLNTTLAKLLATAKGKTSLSDLAPVLEQLAPKAKAAGIDLETMTEAVVTLLDQGKDAQAVVLEFNRTLVQVGSEGIRGLAEQSAVATDGIAEMNTAIDAANGSLENQSKILKEQFNAALIELGANILPIVVAELRGLNGLLALFNGEVAKIKEGAALATIANLARDLNKLPADQKAEEFKRLEKAMRDVAGGGGGFLIDTFDSINRGLNNLTGRSDAELVALQRGLIAAAGSGEVTAFQLGKINDALGKINVEQSKRKPIVTPEEVKTTGVLVDRLREIKNLAAGGASLDEIIAKFGVLSKEEEKVAKHAIAVRKEHERTAKTAETAAAKAKLLYTALQQIGSAQLTATVAVSDEVKESLERLDDYQDSQKRVGDNSDEIRRLQERIQKIQEDQQETLEDINKEEEERIRKNLKLIDDVTSVARGLVGAGTAAGALTDEMAATLQSVISIGEEIAEIKVSGKELLDPSNLASLAGIVGAAIGVISSLFGDSPETKARKELLEKNTQALRELTEVQGDILRISEPGARLQSVEDALQAAFDKAGGSPGPVRVGRELAEVGLTIKDLEEVAETLGLSIRNAETGQLDIDAIRQVLEALKDFDVGFEDTFQGQLDRIRTLIETGLLRPSQEMAALLDLLTRGDLASPAITDALKDIDVFGDPESAVAALQGLIEKFAAGELTKGELGGLSGQEFLDAIADLIAFLQDDKDDERLGSGRDPLTDPDLEERPPDEIGDLPDDDEVRRLGDGVSEAVAGPFGDMVEALRSTEEETVSFYADSLSLQDEQLVALQQLVRNTAQSLVPAPSLPSTGGGGGGGLVIQNLSVSLNAIAGETTEQTARRAGETVASSIAEAVDRELGTRKSFITLRETGFILKSA